MRIGLHMGPPAQPNMLGRAKWAEANGYESLWIPDGAGRMDAFTTAGGLAPQTERVRLCTSIVPVFTRPAAVIATSTLAMAHLAPGRFVLGLGASSQTMVEGWYGTPYTRPLTRVRETVEALRQMFTGQKVNFEGETFYSRNFRLAEPLPERVPIYLAGLRPKMLELAGEIADGVILNLVPLELVPRMLEHIEAGAKRAGRTLADLEIALFLYVFATDDPAGARKQMAGIAASYFSTPVYSRFLEWMGYPREAQMILEGFKEKDRSKTLGAFSDEVLHKLAIIGSVAECQAAVRAYGAAGITTAVIDAASTVPEEFEATLEAFTAPALAG